MLESLSNFEEEWEGVRQVLPSLRVLNVSWCLVRLRMLGLEVVSGSLKSREGK